MRSFDFIYDGDHATYSVRIDYRYNMRGGEPNWELDHTSCVTEYRYTLDHLGEIVFPACVCGGVLGFLRKNSAGFREDLERRILQDIADNDTSWVSDEASQGWQYVADCMEGI